MISMRNGTTTVDKAKIIAKRQKKSGTRQKS